MIFGKRTKGLELAQGSPSRRLKSFLLWLLLITVLEEKHVGSTLLVLDDQFEGGWDVFLWRELGPELGIAVSSHRVRLVDTDRRPRLGGNVFPDQILIPIVQQNLGVVSIQGATNAISSTLAHSSDHSFDHRTRRTACRGTREVVGAVLDVPRLPDFVS